MLKDPTPIEDIYISHPLHACKKLGPLGNVSTYSTPYGPLLCLQNGLGEQYLHDELYEYVQYLILSHANVCEGESRKGPIAH